ncbi:hypothetical protein [Streptomyces antimycoticus]|uniref:hypothetical protein n=1 Tax=Streptomyces antimycoticus TaxID=68175 RepID=UPI0025710DA0|nr:hypothetical protein [Streptomyces antimycoticus]WJD98332.1 hypothetical protein QR300_21405 [Streptomyces antimycoticus]
MRRSRPDISRARAQVDDALPGEDERLDVRVADGRLTPQGAALRERTRTVPPAIGDAIGLGDDEIKTVQKLLRRLTTNVEQHASGKGKGNGNSSAGSGPAESTP